MFFASKLRNLSYIEVNFDRRCSTYGQLGPPFKKLTRKSGLFECYDLDMHKAQVDTLDLRQAIEASWQLDSAYEHIEERGNPSLGQCHVTALVVHHYYPETRIVEGEVQTGKGLEKHFWNMFHIDGHDLHLDWTWQQFPHGSTIKSWKVRAKDDINNSQDTTDRFKRLLRRVKYELSKL